jgi:hypothetical protein
MTKTTLNAFIGFVLTPMFQVKPVEVRPHPVMDAYGILPTGKRVHLSLVYATAYEAIQKGHDTLHKMGVNVANTMDNIERRKTNLDKAKASVDKAGVRA